MKITDVPRDVVAVTVVWSGARRRTTLSKDVNFHSGEQILTYRFNRHVAAGERLLVSTFTAIVSLVDGSEFRVTTENEVPMIDIPRDVLIQRVGDSLRVTWTQEPYPRPFQTYRVGIGGAGSSIQGPILIPEGIEYFSELVKETRGDVREHNALILDSLALEDGVTYEFIFNAQVETAFMADSRPFTW